MKIGSLIKELLEQKLFSPRPKSPFLGLTVSKMTDSVRNFRFNDGHLGRYHKGQYCSRKLRDYVEATLDNLAGYMNGLFLDHYLGQNIDAST
jgi:hypothetical protein